ncbi:MAG: efflux RND transporter permease subunit, partial [Bacilli bacterium]
MSIFTKWTFANRSAVALVTVLVVVLSALSVFRIPMELFPAADQPSVVVVSYAGGIDAKTMETEVTNPIEQVLGNITG